jgi:hypothetical protein
MYNGGDIRDMVLMEKVISVSLKENGGYESFISPSNRIIKSLKSYSKWMYEINNTITDQVQSQITRLNSKLQYVLRECEKDETELYNMEPFAGPAIFIDMGIDLYDMESE